MEDKTTKTESLTDEQVEDFRKKKVVWREVQWLATVDALRAEVERLRARESYLEASISDTCAELDAARSVATVRLAKVAPRPHTCGHPDAECDVDCMRDAAAAEEMVRRRQAEAALARVREEVRDALTSFDGGDDFAINNLRAALDDAAPDGVWLTRERLRCVLEQAAVEGWNEHRKGGIDVETRVAPILSDVMPAGGSDER